MQKIGIIGGGPSGLTAAIFSKTKFNEVTILEKNKNCGKKLLLTGSGKCNYWNDDMSITHFHSSNTKILKNIITEELKTMALEFTRNIGIIPTVKNGYYYPITKESFTMQMALLRECQNKGIVIKNECNVIDIKKVNDSFIVKTPTETLKFDKIIIATGGLSYPKTGSDGAGYTLVKETTIVPPKPSLVQLTIEADFLKKWAGIRTMATVTLLKNNQVIKTETGEIQLTDYGASGICIFNISREAEDGDILEINFCPFLETSLEEFLTIENKRLENRKLRELLENILHFKLVDIVLNKSGINGNLNYAALPKKERQKLTELCTSLKLKITGNKGFLTAQVTNGGISLSELNPETLMSKKIKNLFYAGEVIDIDGDCGGYNLMTAFMTGIKAGRGARND